VDHQEKLIKERKVWEKRILEFESSSASVAKHAPAAKSQNLIKVITPQEKNSILPGPVWLASFIKAFYKVHLLL